MRETGVMLGDEIKEAGIVDQNAVDWCFKAASYDLRVGDQYIDPADNISKESGRVKAVAIGFEGEPIVVPAYSSIVVSSHEILKIPGDVIGKFNLRIRWALKGLFVQMGTQVEPHYHGRLFAVLHNITSSDVVIKRKPNDTNDNEDRDRLFTIEFYKIGAVAPKKEDAKIYESMPEFVGKTPFARSAIKEMFERTSSFQEDLAKMQEAVKGTIEELKAGLIANADRVLNSAQSQVDMVQRLSSSYDENRQEAMNRLETKFDEKAAQFNRVEERVHSDVNKMDAAIEKMRNDRTSAITTVAVGGVVVVLASALIPFMISVAVSWANPIIPSSLLDPLREELRTVKEAVDSVSTKKDEEKRVQALQATITAQQGKIDSLVKRLDEMQSRLQDEKVPVVNDGLDGGQKR